MNHISFYSLEIQLLLYSPTSIIFARSVLMIFQETLFLWVTIHLNLKSKLIVNIYSTKFKKKLFSYIANKIADIIIVHAYCFILFRPINKSEFIEKKNDILDKEPFVECQDCGRKLHQICVLHNESIWRGG